MSFISNSGGQMKIKLDHVNLTVQNIQESIDWYAKIFGFKLAESGTGTRGQPWAIVASNDSMIVMSEYKNKSKADQEFEVDFHKIYHFGIRVSDLATWENIVKENNLRLYYGGVVNYSAEVNTDGTDGTTCGTSTTAKNKTPSIQNNWN